MKIPRDLFVYILFTIPTRLHSMCIYIVDTFVFLLKIIINAPRNAWPENPYEISTARLFVINAFISTFIYILEKFFIYCIN